MNDEFQRALQLHQRGQLRDAEIGYRKVLQQNPDHADALHLLGVIAHQCGSSADATAWIQRAIAINPQCAAYHSNLSDAHRMLRQYDIAIACCEQALRIDPEFLDAHNNLALALLAVRRFNEAEAVLRKVLQQNPQFVAAYNNIGHALREQDRIDEAIEAYREAVRLAPEMAEAHNNLGQVLLEADAIDDALIHCREAVRLKPDFPQAHSNLGNVLREQQKLETARACYTEALRLNDRIGMIHNNMGQLVQEEGRFDEAIVWYRQALSLEPDTARFHANLASALADQENYDEAIEHFQKAIRLQPDSADAYNGLGHLYQEMEDYERALEMLRKAISFKPSLTAAHVNLGQVLAVQGKLDESLSEFREAIRHDPMATAPWTSIAVHHRRSLQKNEVEQIEGLLSLPYLKDGQIAALNSALAHIYDADQQPARAAKASRLANQFQRVANERRGDVYSADEHSEFVDQLITAFDGDYFRRAGVGASSPWGRESDLPVFIIGLPRSGTTLTEQILASHPDVHGGGELRLARQSFDSLSQSETETIAQRISAMTPVSVGQAADEYLTHLRSLNRDAHRIVDKMPDNYLYLGWIVTLFPRARIIHCRRDVRDVALSCWLTNFKSIRWASDVDDIANRIKNYKRLMDHWSKHLPIRLLELDYEETVSDLPAVARRLLDWIDLPWDAQCLEFHKTDRPIRTASVTQVRQPVHVRSVAKWKNYAHDLKDLFVPLAMPDD